MAKRSYVIYGARSKGGVTETKILDSVSPFMKQLVIDNPKMAKGAIKNVAFLARTELKEIYKNEGKGFGVSVKRKSKFKMSGSQLQANRNANEIRTGKKIGLRAKDKKKIKLRKEKLFGNLYNSIGYQDIGDGRVIGFLSRSSANIARVLQKGIRQNVTKRMFGHFMKLGIRLRKQTSFIRRPRREIIKPYHKINEKRHLKYFEKRFSEKYNKMAKVYNRKAA